MARFEEPQELVMYLLQETILSDKHIEKCEFCGRFFISRRSTRQYCSPACASKQRNLDGFCGEREVSAAYKRFVANLSTKDKKQKELRRQYCLDGGAVVKPREVLRQFYDENYTHQEQFRSAWEALNKAEKKAGRIARHTSILKRIICSGWTSNSAMSSGFILITTAF